jgi:1-acyl-sn-glycerol-3-phosphate acyltransferase
LYGLAGVAAVPVKVHSGGCWPAGSLLKYPGTIKVEILPPIPAGLDRRSFLEELGKALAENPDDLKH